MATESRAQRPNEISGPILHSRAHAPTSALRAAEPGEIDRPRSRDVAGDVATVSCDFVITGERARTMLSVAAMRSNFFRCLLPLLLAVFARFGSGCAHQPAVGGASSVPQKARVAVPCPELSARRRNAEPERVFLEMTEVVSDGDPKALEEMLRDRAVVVRAGSGSLASDHETVALPWPRCLNPRCTAQSPATLKAMPKLPSLPSEPIEIVLELASEGAAPHLQATVSARDQRPAVAGRLLTVEGAYVSTLVVTPYLFDGQDDLRSLLACKKRVNEEARYTGDTLP